MSVDVFHVCRVGSRPLGVPQVSCCVTFLPRARLLCSTRPGNPSSHDKKVH